MTGVPWCFSFTSWVWCTFPSLSTSHSGVFLEEVKGPLLQPAVYAYLADSLHIFLAFFL